MIKNKLTNTNRKGTSYSGWRRAKYGLDSLSILKTVSDVIRKRKSVTENKAFGIDYRSEIAFVRWTLCHRLIC